MAKQDAQLSQRDCVMMRHVIKCFTKSSTSLKVVENGTTRKLE